MRNEIQRLSGACVGISLLAACQNSPAGPAGTGIARIDVIPDPLILLVGQSGNLNATAMDSLGLPMTAPSIGWSIASTAVARIDNTGAVTGVSPGTTTATARSGSVRGTAEVRVIAGFTLEVVPATATTQIGGTVPFTVIAKDASGLTVPAPPVTWSSSAPAIATIAANGLALGRTAGTTTIGAAAGSVVARPGQLTVTTSAPCVSIAQVDSFALQVGMAWARNGVNAQGRRIEAEHRMEVRSTMKRVGPPVPTPTKEWVGTPGGSAFINDKDIDPATMSTYALRGGGPVLATMLGNLPTPEFRFVVDLDLCRYYFEVSPWISATATPPTGNAFTGPYSVGVIMSGWMDLPAGWRTLGLAGFDERFDTHSTLWLGGKFFPRAYIPSGYGALFFAGSTGTGEAAEGSALVNWAINAK